MSLVEQTLNHYQKTGICSNKVFSFGNGMHDEKLVNYNKQVTCKFCKTSNPAIVTIKNLGTNLQNYQIMNMKTYYTRLLKFKNVYRTSQVDRVITFNRIRSDYDLCLS